jgi:phosphonate transport system substrate-binding protein
MSTLNASVTPSLLARRGAAKVMAMVVLAILVIGGGIGWSLIRASARADTEMHGEQIASMIGLSRPIKNAISAKFTDANKDLVADAPADATKLVDPAEIVFTYVASDDNTAKLEAVFKPFTDALSAATGKPVKYLAIGDVDTEMNALSDGRLHVCAFNTGSVPTAVDVAGFVPVALLGGESGPSSYQLKIIASPKSNIGSVEALRGRELALTEMSSNSGYKAPLVLLQQKYGMRPGFDFGIRYSQGYTPSIDGLVDGTFEAIAVASDVLARAERAGKIKPADYRVLYTSDAFPTACFGYAYNLKPDLAAKIQSAVLAFPLKDDATAAYFAASGQTKFVKCEYAKDFALVREIDDAIGYEHKLRAPASAEEPTTMPTTQPGV